VSDISESLLINEPENGALNQYYELANRLRTSRVHGWQKTRLDDIVLEVKTRVKICKREIYFIGELLVEAKKIVGHGNFKNWIAETFEFSYETANNYMNVYNACLGNPFYADSIKASVLYQIAAPSFPKDLREHLFEHEGWELKNFTNADIRDLLIKYKAGELDLESEGIKKLFNRNRRMVQLSDVMDRITLCIRDLDRHWANISTVGGTVPYGYGGGVNEGQDPEAEEKIREVLHIIEGCKRDLLRAEFSINNLMAEEIPDIPVTSDPEDVPKRLINVNFT
jgi:hypothetical protein